MFGAIPKCPPVCADSQQALTGMDCCVPGHMMLLTNKALCVLGLAATGVGAMYYLLRSFEQRSHKTAFTGITLAAEAAALANSSPGTLSPKHLGPLIHILRDIDGQQSPDDDLAERILVTLANSAAFTGSQNSIREMSGLPVIARYVHSTEQRLQIQALNALNNLAMNVENQKHLQAYVVDVFEAGLEAGALEDVQLAALRVLTNVTVTGRIHDSFFTYLPAIWAMLQLPNTVLQVQVLKLLVNLSGDEAMKAEMLDLEVSSDMLLSLLHEDSSEDVIERFLTLAEHLIRKPSQCDLPPRPGSLRCFLWAEQSLFLQKVYAFKNHLNPDISVRVGSILSVLNALLYR
uniref:armadillo repeat-containing protein 10-like n=1 Tax=Myxine glutinosa TaxID=7769 RepID=UPI00358EFA17